MPKNKLTQQEKQMPEVRLPVWIFWLCLFDLITVFFVNFTLWNGDHRMLVFTVSFCFFIPALAGMIAYLNCVVRFDKNMICYRNVFRKIQRFSIEQITDVDENGIVATVYIEEVQIPANFRSQNGKWLQKLITAKATTKNPTTESSEEQIKIILEKDRKEREEKEKKKNRLQLIFWGIAMLVLFLLRISGY